jgi:hypothetical protein
MGALAIPRDSDSFGSSQLGAKLGRSFYVPLPWPVGELMSAVAAAATSAAEHRDGVAAAVAIVSEGAALGRVAKGDRCGSRWRFDHGDAGRKRY